MRPPCSVHSLLRLTLRIEGQVVDNAGQGIQGATVSAEGIAQSVFTDATGRYVMELPPGQQNLTFTHPAYFSQAEAIHVAPDEATALPRRTLIKTPDGDGLHVLSGAEVLPLPAARLKRQTRTADGAKLRSYCIAGPKSSTASIPAGQTQFVDMSSSSWRLFKLDSDGCAYRDEKDSNGRWVVRYRSKPPVKPIPLASQGGVRRGHAGGRDLLRGGLGWILRPRP